MDLVSSLIRSKTNEVSDSGPDVTYGRYIQIYGLDAYVAFVTPRDLLVSVARLLVKKASPSRIVLCKLPNEYRSDDLPESAGSLPMSLEGLKEVLSSFDIDLSGGVSSRCDHDAGFVRLASFINTTSYSNVGELLRDLAALFGLEVARFTDGVRLEYLGLEVARQIDGTNIVSVGSSERDRQARDLMYLSGYDIRVELEKTLSQLQVNRLSFGSLHPHALLCRDRWMRVLVAKRPEIIGFQIVQPLEISSLDEPTPRCYGIGESLNGSSTLLCFTSGPDIAAPFEALLLLSVLRCSSTVRPCPTKISFIVQRRDVTEAFRTILMRSSQDWEIITVSERWFDLPEKRNLC